MVKSITDNNFKFIFTMSSKNNCFCGSHKSYAACCERFLEQNDLNPHNPETAEQLMRSRFSAYATRNSQYIYDTYAENSKSSHTVEEIDEWAKACQWIALEVHSTLKGEKIVNKHHEQFVEFSAFYISNNTLYELRENSCFIVENVLNERDLMQESTLNVRWRYLDGDIIKHCELSKIKRNSLCPCNKYPTAWSEKKGKKYKQCCGK